MVPYRPTPGTGGQRPNGCVCHQSPFRPNGLGLSSVRLLSIDWQTPRGPVLCVAGADLKDGTPIFDIKPYLPYTDAHPEAASGFARPRGGPPAGGKSAGGPFPAAARGKAPGAVGNIGPRPPPPLSKGFSADLRAGFCRIFRFGLLWPTIRLRCWKSRLSPDFFRTQAFLGNLALFFAPLHILKIIRGDATMNSPKKIAWGPLCFRWLSLWRWAAPLPC